MKRLAIALLLLLSLNLLTLGLRSLITSNILPLTHLWLPGLIGLGILVLTYFSTLEISAWDALAHPQTRVYVAAGLVGILLGLL